MRLFLLSGRAKARDVLDVHGVVGQALGESPVVLLGEDRGGHQHQDLLALGRGLEGCPQGNLGLAVAHVAADQAVHGPGGFHVGLDLLDGLTLVGCLHVGEALFELALPVRIGLELVPGAPTTLGIEAQQLTRQLLGGAAGARLHRLPARAPELGERRVLGAGADVARDLGQLVGGHEHAVVALVFEVEVVAGDARHGARLKAREARHAVVFVHHDVARAQVGERAQRPAPHAAGATPGRTRTATPGGPPTAQQAMLGVDGQLQAGRHEALA